MKVNTITLPVCVLILLVMPVPAKDWRGITPMKSKRTDVKRLLGTPVAETGYERYELTGETVSVEYVRYPCHLKPPQGCSIPPPVCELPSETVLSVTVRLRRPIPTSTLSFDLSEFEKVPDDHHSGRLFFYMNRVEGFSVHVLDDEVVAYGYHPTREDQKLFHCRGAQ